MKKKNIWNQNETKERRRKNWKYLQTKKNLLKKCFVHKLSKSRRIKENKKMEKMNENIEIKGLCVKDGKESQRMKSDWLEKDTKK